LKDKVYFIEASSSVSKFVNDYKVEFGIIKFRRQNEIIETSRNVRDFMARFKDGPHPVNGDDFFFTIINNPGYLFAKKRTIAVASLLLLSKWDFEINQQYEMYSLHEVENIAARILFLSLNGLKI
jgi:hypothetical protein